MTSYAEDRARRLAIADATPGFERVKYHDGPLTRLDWRTGLAAPYIRQQRRNRDREEARLPSFSDRLAFALGQIDWSGGIANSDGMRLSAMGLMQTSPYSTVIHRRVKRYRAAYLSERAEPSKRGKSNETDEGWNKALSTVLAGAAILQG